VILDVSVAEGGAQIHPNRMLNLGWVGFGTVITCFAPETTSRSGTTLSNAQHLWL
jgi:hypothetical protein